MKSENILYCSLINEIDSCLIITTSGSWHQGNWKLVLENDHFARVENVRSNCRGGCRTGNVGLITDNIAEMENVGLENAWSCMISFVHFQSLIFQSSIFPTTRHHHLFGYYFSTDCNGRPFYLLFWWSVRDVSTSMNSFSGRLKAELFHRAYGTDLSPMWQLSVISLSEHKYSFFLSLTYLLTYLLTKQFQSTFESWTVSQSL